MFLGLPREYHPLASFNHANNLKRQPRSQSIEKRFGISFQSVNIAPSVPKLEDIVSPVQPRARFNGSGSSSRLPDSVHRDS